MATDHIRYDLLAQNALRGVVRQVLADAAREGLIGEHHFYISFKTQYPGVRISDRLIEKFPEEITVILQHQFWDLTVSDTGFEVGMSFSGAPEKLSVPFEAVTGFFDPSVQFGLKFELMPEEVANPSTLFVGSQPASDKAIGEPADKKTKPSPGEVAKSQDLKVVAEKSPAGADQPTGEKIISLDTFRKKK